MSPIRRLIAVSLGNALNRLQLSSVWCVSWFHRWIAPLFL